MKNFFISDTHFFHANIIKYENRPFANVREMNEEMIRRWNKKVSPEDNVYILGDFSFGKVDETCELLKRLNGKKYLIKGNHDKVVKTKRVADMFEWIKPYHVYKDKKTGLSAVLFHFPIYTWDREHHGALHFYGHVHSGSHHGNPYHPQAINVGVDVNNFEPIEFMEIMELMKKRGSVWLQENTL